MNDMYDRIEGESDAEYFERLDKFEKWFLEGYDEFGL